MREPAVVRCRLTIACSSTQASRILLTLTSLRDPLRLTVLYCVSIPLLGLPIVWTFDPAGNRGILAGLVLGSVAMLVPMGLYLILPRRWGLSLFALESFLLWLGSLIAFDLTAVFRYFMLWSLLELPMYAFELLGLLDDQGAAPRRPEATPLLLAWLLILGIDYSICYVYESVVRPVEWPDSLRPVAICLAAVPFIIILRNVIRRALQRVTAEPMSVRAAG